MDFDSEQQFLMAFEQAVQAHGVKIVRRETLDNELMGGFTYMYKLGHGDDWWSLYPVSTFVIEHPENLGMAEAMAEHAVKRGRYKR